MDLLIICVVSYLIGSLPFGLIIVKVVKGKNIRDIGSGNIGTTNVLRAGYPFLAFLTLIYDLGKGALAVIIFKYFYTSYNITFITRDTIYCLSALSAIIGHMFPIWLNFKGGKGVATGLGSILVINPTIGIMCLLTWIIVAILFKYSSFAAISTFLVLPVYTYVWQKDIFLYTIIISTLIVIKHRSNIKNLIEKKETKIQFRKK